jgi:hypothetical protein
MKLAIIHRGSKTARQVIEETGIPRYRRGVRPECIINYGVAGERMTRWQRLNPWGARLPMINRDLGRNKLEVVQTMKEFIPCPDSKTVLSHDDEIHEWLVKPYYSQGGRGIEIATGGRTMGGKYYQKRIVNRKYELRVHAFMWMPVEELKVQKRVGEPDQVTWNHHTGGTFITVNDTGQRVFQLAQDFSRLVLIKLKMGFGACDFIVDEARNIYFIEVNSAPGAQELSLPIYVGAFRELREKEIEEVVGYAT